MSEAAALAPDTSVSEVAQLPPLTEEQSHFLIEHVWRFFCSLRLVVANFIGLFFGMVAGTFVNPANDTLANIERAFAGRPVVLWAYRTFELYDLFHSWWFTLLLLSLGLNLIACSLERLPRIYYLVRYPQLRLEEIKGLRLPVVQSEAKLGAAEVQAVLARRGYRTVVSPRDDGGADIFAERGRYARFGVWVIHIFLLVVLGGGIVGRLTAFEGTTDVPQNGGETDSFVVRRPDGSAYKKPLGFIVKCDDFRLKEFSPGRPKAFESDLRVLSTEPGREGQVLARKTITVNDPLKYGGLTFYQASYRQLDEGQRARMALIDKATGKEQPFLVSSAEPIEAAEGLAYQVVDYNDDFGGMGPAVQVLRIEEPPGAAVRNARGPMRQPLPGSKLTSFWVFKSRPEFDRDNREDRFALRFDRLAAFYATGLQVAKDPSIPVVYTGCFGIFLGIGIAFYTSHKRVWARVAGGKLALGGAAHRNQEGFADEMVSLCAELGLPPPRRKGEAA
jgi:cytochrome c biogenesis protein